MHILLLGASGRTGSQILTHALSQNHTITALVRSSSSLTPAPGLAIILASPTSPVNLRTALSSPPNTKTDAVIIALASVRESDSPFSKPVSPEHLMEDTHRALLPIMKELGIKRLVTISAFGVGDSNGSVFWPLRVVLNYSNMNVGMKDHEGVERYLKEEGRGMGVQWTLVRPVMLGDGEGERKEVKVFGEKGEGTKWLGKISRGRVARWVLGEVVRGEWVGRTPVIGEV